MSKSFKKGYNSRGASTANQSRTLNQNADDSMQNLSNSLVQMRQMAFDHGQEPASRSLRIPKDLLREDLGGDDGGQSLQEE